MAIKNKRKIASIIASSRIILLSTVNSQFFRRKLANFMLFSRLVSKMPNIFHNWLHKFAIILHYNSDSPVWFFFCLFVFCCCCCFCFFLRRFQNVWYLPLLIAQIHDYFAAKQQNSWVFFPICFQNVRYFSWSTAHISDYLTAKRQNVLFSRLFK